MPEFEEKTKIIQEYLIGDPRDKKLKKRLAEKYKITTREVTSIVNASPNTNTDIEKKLFEIPLAIEQEKIHQLKMKMLEFFLEAVNDGMKEKKKHLYQEGFLKVLEKIDTMQRLNEGKATEITKHEDQQTKIDVAEILKELDTPEKKKSFLLSGINKK